MTLDDKSLCEFEAEGLSRGHRFHPPAWQERTLDLFPGPRGRAPDPRTEALESLSVDWS